jgi:L-asparaginase
MSNKNKVLIIYTGGTIGMKRSDSGFAPTKGYLAEAISHIPDLSSPSMPEWNLFEMDPLLDSSDMTVKEWNLIGRKIYEKTSWGAGHGLYKYLIFSLPFMLMAYLAYLIQKLLLRKQKPTEAPKI